MASSDVTKSQLQADYLTCLICSELYTDPCTLTCGHSFCKKCLLKYMKTQPAAIKARHLLCPYCRQTMPVANPAGPVEDWVEQLQPTVIVKKLLDQFGSVRTASSRKARMNVQSTSWCPSCNFTLCKGCVKIHNAMSSISHHVISDLSDEAKVVKRKVICREHNIVIEFFCKDCNTTLCHKCSTRNHRKCEFIVAIESVLPDIKSCLTERLDIMLGEMTKIEVDLKVQDEHIQDIESRQQYLVRKITSTSKMWCRSLTFTKSSIKAIRHIKQQEKHLLEEIEEVANNDKEKLTTPIKTSQIDLQMYQQYTEFITNALTSDGVMDMCEMYKRCQSGDVKVSVNHAAIFVNNPEITKLCFVEGLSPSKLMTNLSLGGLVKDYLSTCTPALQDTIDIRVDSDEETADPEDVVVLDLDDITTLVVTDFKNNCIKSFYNKDDQQHHSKLCLGKTPHTIAILDKCKVVVSFYDQKELAVVLVIPDLVLDSSINTSKEYLCVTALSTSTLAAGCVYPPSVDILDMTGTVLRSLTSLTSAPRPLKYPQFLRRTNEGNILISDEESQSVCCVTPEGDVQFTYHCACKVQGIATSTTGHILVVDMYNNTVIQLTKTGEFYRELLTSRDGVGIPYDICLYGDKLYISELYGKINVYSLNTR